MNQENIIKFLSMVHADRIKIGPNGWVESCCPLAPWAHSGGTDKHPSFGISISNDDKSGYKCFTCHNQGTLMDLAWKIHRSSNWLYEDAVKFVSKNDLMSLDVMDKLIDGIKPHWAVGRSKLGGLTVSSADIKKPEDLVDDTFPQKDYDSLVSALPEDVRHYLTDPKIPVLDRVDGYTPRALTSETVSKFELGWDQNKQRIIIPVRDISGRLVGITGRAFHKWTKPKFYHYPGFRKQRYLFGEFLAKKGGVGYLVEGHFDAMWLYQMGYGRACAVMGSDLSDFQLTKLCKMFTSVVYVRDGDEPGIKAEERIKEKLHGHIPITSVEIPNGFDPDDLNSEQLQDLLGEPDADDYPF